LSVLSAHRPLPNFLQIHRVVSKMELPDRQILSAITSPLYAVCPNWLIAQQIFNPTMIFLHPNIISSTCPLLWYLLLSVAAQSYSVLLHPYFVQIKNKCTRSFNVSGVLKLKFSKSHLSKNLRTAFMLLIPRRQISKT